MTSFLSLGGRDVPVHDIPKRFRGPLAALLVLSTGSCAMGRDSSDYSSFLASHDAIRPGMSMQQVFEAGLADYLIKLGGKNVAGSTTPE